MELVRRALAPLGGSNESSQVSKGLAAVALVLAGGDSDLSLCFIHRAEREGDPWSGHMAFPGGRASMSDATVQAVAEREVMEEIGLRLSPDSFVGTLPPIPIRRLAIDTGMVLFPFVYYVGVDRAPLSLNHEVAEAFWISLDYLWDRRNATTMEVPYDGVPIVFPAIRFKDQHIWGLTFRVLSEFAGLAGDPLPQG